MPNDTNWVGNIYHGMSSDNLQPVEEPTDDYLAYIGRIIEPKGVHLAISAVQKYNKSAQTPIRLRIAGKHYSEVSKDTYWREKIEPELDDPNIIYEGYLDNDRQKQHFLANARALMVPSLFEEPFGMVTLEAFACETPVIALDSGALPEVVESGKTGIVVQKQYQGNQLDELATVALLTQAIDEIASIRRSACRDAYETKYTITKMAEAHSEVYRRLADAASA